MNKMSNNFGKWGWGLIIYCFLTYFICAFGNNTTQIACGVWEQMYGWDQTRVLALPTLGGYLSVIIVYLVSILYSKSKVKLKTILIIGGILYSVAILFWGVVSNFAVFALLLISMYTTYVLWMQFANNTLTSNWFPHKKGIVIGITTIGLVVGSAFGTPLFGAMMGSLGLMKSYFIIGGFGIVLTLVGYFLFSEYPEQRGCFPDNDRSMTTEMAKAEMEAGLRELEKSPWTPKNMLSIKETWLVAISTGVLIFIASGAMQQMVPRLLAGGYELQQAYSIMLVGGIFAIPGSYLLGLLDAKVGPKKATIITLIIVACGALINTLNTPVAIYVSMAIIGGGMGGAANFLVSMTTEYWGRYNFQKSYGTLLTINQLVGMSGAAFHAYMTKWLGFKWAFVALAVMCVIGIILILPVRDGFVEKAEKRFAAEGSASNE